MPVSRIHNRLGLAVLLLLAAPELAPAQGMLEASYAITAARIPIGTVTASAEFGDGRYNMAASGRASGMLRIFASGEGKLSASGMLIDGRPRPTEFLARTTTDDDTLDVRLSFDGGNVTTFTASPPPPSPDRVELTDAHRQGVIDPLSALLVPAAAESPSAADCQRTLPIFDGRRRFDLKLAFKRMDKVRADKGYAGPVVVCSVTLVPVAGYRPSSTMVKFLTNGRDIELVLAPVAGSHLLAPFRVTVASMLGNLVVQAGRFEVVAQSSQRAQMTTGQAP